MTDTDSKTFFKNLKRTVGFINKAVSHVTTAASKIDSEGYECNGEARKELEEKSDEIKHTYGEAVTLRKTFKDKNLFYGNYFEDVQDLVLEIEEIVQKHENHLQKYGYEPLQKTSVEELVSSPEVPPIEIESRQTNKTPTFCALQIKRTTRSEEKEKVKELVTSDGTPELILDQVLRKQESLESLESPTTEFNNNDENNATPQILSLPVLKTVENSVLIDQSVNDSLIDFQIARRLDFC